MKFILSLVALFAIVTQGFSQIHGNSQLKTITKNLEGVKSIDIQFNANITLDYNLKEDLVITADENILEYIGIKFRNGKLTLDQIKWIEPSQLPTIVLGTPNIQTVYQGTHSSTNIINVKGQNLNLKGNVGKINASGTIDNLKVKTTGTEMDLSNLKIGKADISINDDSKVTIDKVNILEKDIAKDSRLILLSSVNGSDGEEFKKTKPIKEDKSISWIDFKIKNNSWKRNHFIVVGPKRDGSKFSYGFSLFPNATREERWSTGTKIYKDKKIGKELLVTITADDEGKVVDLFE